MNLAQDGRQRHLAALYVTAHSGLSYSDLWALLPNPLPDPPCRMPLLLRRLLVTGQNPVNKVLHWPRLGQLRSACFRFGGVAHPSACRTIRR
jgi:hypothetical protein